MKKTQILVLSCAGLLLASASAHHGARPASSGPSFVEAAGSPIRIGQSPAGIDLGDVNGDGKLDVVTANGDGNSISILLGDGRGGFREAAGSPFAAGPKPHIVVLGDVNNDRKLDLAATEHDGNEVRVFLGDGTGRFAPAPGSPFPAVQGTRPHNHGLSFADVNGDGDIDIITSNQNDKSVSVLLGDGKGRFRAAPGSPFPVGGSPYPHALGDLNGDGKLDVVTPNIQENCLSVLLGDGKGAFHVALGSPYRTEIRPYHAVLGDVNGDGKLDIVATHDDITLVSVLLGDGRGGFRRGPSSDAGHRGGRVELHDLNGDKKMDLLTIGSGYLMVLLGDGAGHFTPAPGSPYASRRGAWTFATGDFNSDGKLDIVTANHEDSSVTVLLGR